MYLQTIQTIDEKGDCNKVKFYSGNKENEGQGNSHGLSYLFMRENYYKDFVNEKIGLENLVLKENTPPHPPKRK